MLLPLEHARVWVGGFGALGVLRLLELLELIGGDAVLKFNGPRLTHDGDPLSGVADLVRVLSGAGVLQGALQHRV